MHTVTIAVDLAKTVFELAVANQNHRITERHRLSRTQFERFWGKRESCRVVMEACASAHYWARSEDQQAIAVLHRVRSQWMGTRTARINGIRALEARVAGIERELEALVQQEPVLQTLRQIPGVGVLTATALYAAVGNIHAFQSGRHLASWLGLTPRESSSGARRRLGRISKQGDVYLRMLLIHGARSALLGAQRRERAGQPLSHLQRWALKKPRDRHVSKAAVALANKLARVIWAV